MSYPQKWQISSLLLLIIVGFGFTEEKKEDKEYYHLDKVEEVVVTATMTPKALKECAASVHVIGQGEMESLATANALNSLNTLPSIFVNRSGDFGRADVDIRGLGQNCRRIAVLVDGKPEKMGLYGCAVSHAFPMDNVERIEVVKGPVSVLYGGEALGGAVNIITRLPEKKIEMDFTTGYGSYNTQQINFKHGAILDKFKYYVTFDRRKSDGHIDNASYSGYSFTGKLVYDLAETTRFTLQGKYFAGKKYEPGTIDNPLLDFWNDYKRGAVDFSINRQGQKDEFFIKAYRNFGKHRFSDGWDSEDFTNGVMVRYTTRAIAGNELTLGGDYRYFGGESFGWPQGEWDKKEGALFAYNEIAFNSQWVLSGGIRLQLDSLYGRELCPQVGLVFHASRHTLFRALVSKGFRSPQLNELYIFPPANPDLQPERVWNIELGFRQDLGQGLTMAGSLFHMKGTDLIQTVLNPSAPPMYIFANSGDFSYYGVELELEAFSGRSLSGRIAYSYLHTGDFTRGKPGQKIDVSLRFRKSIFYAAFQGQYISDYYAADFSEDRIPSYFLLNSRFIITVSKHFDLVVDINNIFDKSYWIYGEFPGMTAGLYRMPGRNFQLGVHFGL
jgi:vitamin B12 transporter